MRSTTTDTYLDAAARSRAAHPSSRRRDRDSDLLDVTMTLAEWHRQRAVAPEVRIVAQRAKGSRAA